jgi:ABC-2 type transport system ATP-binding protein
MRSDAQESAGPAIDTRDLRKVFGTQTAVGGLTLTVPRGEIFGFLGPNGAGKSTSIKMLLGLVRPTAGSARVLGAPVGDVALRRAIGFLPEDFRFYDWLTATELVRLHGRLSGMSAAALRTRVPAVIERVGLAEHRDRTLRGFSKGMLQRIGLAQALVHEPELVFLDEPTSGLDPMGRRLVRDILREERARGATVFLNSHLLSEIEVTCDRVAFIKRGEVVATRDLHAAPATAVHVTVRARNVSPAAIAGLASLTAAAEQRDEQLSLRIASLDAVPEVVRHLVGAGADVLEVTPARERLEDVFMELIGEDSGQ